MDSYGRDETVVNFDLDIRRWGRQFRRRSSQYTAGVRGRRFGHPPREPDARLAITGLIHAGKQEFDQRPAPANGTVAYARLYIYTTWGHDEEEEGTPVGSTLRRKNFIADRVYNDRKDEGSTTICLRRTFNVTGVRAALPAAS